MSVDAINSIDLHLRWSTSTSEKIDLYAKCHGFRPIRNHFRGQSSRRALFGHTGCWLIAKCSQISCWNYTGGFQSWPPATCKFSTRRSFDHHGKGNGNFVQKKSFEKWKKVISLIDLKVMKTQNDCEIACDCVKRANVVLHVGLCKEIFSRKHTATHKPTFAQPLIVTTMTHTYTHSSPVEPLGLRPSGAKICSFTVPMYWGSIPRNVPFQQSISRWLRHFDFWT